MMTSVAFHTLRIDWRRLIHPVARLWADHDPGGGTFVKQWVPELRDASPKAIAKHTSGQYIEGYRPPLLDDRIASFKSFKDDYYAIERRPETRALDEEVYAKHRSRRAVGAGRG